MKKVFLVAAVLFFAICSYAQDAAEKINQANEALKAKDYAKAYTLYDEAMNNLGGVEVPVAINYNIGLAACKSGNAEGAEKYMAKAIEAAVNVPKCHENLGDMYLDKKDFTKAVACYEKAIATATEGADALAFKAGGAAYNGKNMDKALEMFDKCIQANYKAETSYFYKSTILKAQNKAAESKAVLEEGVAKFPGDAKMSPALAKVYVTEGNDIYKKGAAIVADANGKVTAGKLKTDAPAYTEAMNKAKEEFQAALVVLEKAKTLDPTNQNAQKLIDACNAANSALK